MSEQKAPGHIATGHALPISNGWSGSLDSITVWCGRCQMSFTPDAEWASRYLAREYRELLRNVGTGYYNITTGRMDELMAELREQFVRCGLIETAAS